LSNKKPVAFLLQQCKEQGLSLRKLSISSGLSPGAVRNIINRPYQPTVFSLNRLADYPGVKREYLWQLAGLPDDMDYGDAASGDPNSGFLLPEWISCPWQPEI